MTTSSAPFALRNMPHWPAFFAGNLPYTPQLRTLYLLEKLGNPHLRLPPVIHVGGTKGKGSTIAFLRTMLEQAGYKVHCYTSPHLDRFNERIVLAGREINDATLFSIIEETRIAAGDMELAFFDGTTAAALLAFAHHPADIVLLETGLGGSIDATNVIAHPLLTILTTISKDHMAIMGYTLSEIATFEAGIMKAHSPCVVSWQHDRVMQVIAENPISTLYSYGTHWQTVKSPQGMIFRDCNGNAALPLPALLGAHQIVNAGNAIAAISLLEDFAVRQQHVVAGLMQVRWKGRLERLACPLLPTTCELWFDGGHNEAAAHAISLFARTHWQDKPLILIFGTTQGKDIASMLAPFTDITHTIYSVEVKSEPGSYTAETITQLAGSVATVTPKAGILEALHEILAMQEVPFRVLIFGSLYLWLEANNCEKVLYG